MTHGVDGSLLDSVSQAIRDVAASAILPRFRALAEAEVTAKGADDVVTAADLEAEALLLERLNFIHPGIPVLGEESSHSDSGLRARAEGSATYWVVDPLDGTKAFVAGRPGFGVMVALVESGTTTAAWIYLPMADRLYDGAFAVPVRRNGTPLAPTVYSASDIGNASGFALTRFAPPEVRAVVDERMGAFPTHVNDGSGSAATAYAALLEGQLDFGFYWRTEPWDHAPGTFLINLAGGRCARLDGVPYSPGDDRTGLLVTKRRDQWAQMLEALYPSASRP